MWVRCVPKGKGKHGFTPPKHTHTHTSICGSTAAGRVSTALLDEKALRAQRLGLLAPWELTTAGSSSSSSRHSQRQVGV